MINIEHNGILRIINPLNFIGGNEMDNIFKISYQVGQIRFDLESSDKDWIELKEKQYIDLLEKKIKHPEIKEVSKADKNNKDNADRSPLIRSSITIQEFFYKYIKGNKITSRPDIAVFFVYYLQKITQKQDIITQDVIKCFSDISYPSYNKINMTDTLNQGKRKALLNNINKIWSLTSTGEDYVLNILSIGE
jgi:hypothetical protein